MRTIMIGLAIAGILALTGPRPALAQANGPWCAYVQIDDDAVAERCDMRSFEMCLAEIRGQSQSFCGPNPRYRGTTGERRPRQRRQ